MEPTIISKLVPTTLLLILVVLESLGGLYLESKRSKNDYAIEIVSLVTLPTLIQPAIFLFVFFCMGLLVPGTENALVHWHIGWHFLAFLIFDDMSQYWWHRISHQNKLLWKLHRPHHVIEEMGVLVTYRNALMYYALMPGIWFSAILIFLGMGYAYLFYLPVKLVVILLAHSETKWDRFLYKYKWLHPLAWLIERTISTPSTHYAHHGLTAEDGVSNPNGNYGNLLFFWDILFGTAKITRKYPTEFGAWNNIKEPWHTQYMFPFLRSSNPKSELHALKTDQDYDPTQENKRYDQ